MKIQFQEIRQAIDTKVQILLSMNPILASDIRNGTPVGGVYLFSEGSTHLYAGRTKRSIAARVRDHFSTADDCPFAWLIAREEVGRKATYHTEGSRKSLLADPTFKSVYEHAKERIRRMHVRYVGESVPERQALLEIYVALASEAKYNDFDTH
jgi:hypothetical protein